MHVRSSLPWVILLAFCAVGAGLPGCLDNPYLIGATRGSGGAEEPGGGSSGAPPAGETGGAGGSCECGDAACFQRVGRALRFVPESSLVVPWDRDVALASEFTVELWFYPVSLNGHLMLRKFEWGREDVVLRFNPALVSSVVFLAPETYATLDVPHSLTAGAWNHVALVYGTSWMGLFVNGMLLDELTDPGAAPEVGAPLFLGASFSSPGIDGFLGDLRVSAGARYGVNFLPSPHLEVDADTLGLWRFTEGEGDTVCDAGPFQMHASFVDLAWESAPPR